jgi:uncharacterized lipoprotein YddW (UPF0748 family)
MPFWPVVTAAPQQLDSPDRFAREFRAAWVASVNNIDWPTAPGLSADEVKNQMDLILDQLQALNMNAVVLQVRPSADALYKSELEPSSYYLTGEQGKTLTRDPLADAIKLAHLRGIEVHVWLNPYRAYHPAQKGAFSAKHFSRTHPEAVYSYGKYLWMDPGSKAVQEHTYRVFMDLVERYDLDGIHIDDYFYPYPEGTAEFPDQKTYADYLAKGGNLAVADWRRKNVDDFIERVYKGVKERKAWVKFGISPFGIWKPGFPAQITGFSQYDKLYADARKWLREGWCDYFTPQLYWPIDKPEQSFPVLLDWWRGENVMGRHIWPGHFTSKVGADGNWAASEIVNQINVIRRGPGTHGTVHFSMKTLLNNSKGISDALRIGVFAEKALVPESPWLSTDRPASPEVVSNEVQTKQGARTWTVRLRKGDGRTVRFFVVSKRVTGGEVPLLVSDSPGFQWRVDETVPMTVTVSAVDRFGNVSSSVEVARPQ